MINFLKTWCEGIIVALMISVIIETMIPDGNNKKYVKVVIGVYIIFTILNPFLGKLDTENIQFTNQINLGTVETANVDTETVKQLYGNGIEQTMKEEIESEFDYTVNKIEIDYDQNYENMEKMYLSISQNNMVNEIKQVEIGNREEEKNDYPDVKKFIADNYEIDSKNIIIN